MLQTVRPASYPSQGIKVLKDLVMRSHSQSICKPHFYTNLGALKCITLIDNRGSWSPRSGTKGRVLVDIAEE
jgi:hypothetical protein